MSLKINFKDFKARKPFGFKARTTEANNLVSGLEAKMEIVPDFEVEEGTELNSAFFRGLEEDINEEFNIRDKQIKNLESQIQNIDVSGDVRQVINERVNADTSKPLSTLISEWVNVAKTAILNSINGLPQKSVWTDARGAKLDNLNQSMTTTQTNITNNADKNKEAIANWTTACRDDIKNHMTSLMANPKVVKSVQRGFIVTDKADYIDRYYSKDYTISPVDPSKTMINLYSQRNYCPVSGRLMNATTLRVFSTTSDHYVADVSWEVIEFY